MVCGSIGYGGVDKIRKMYAVLHQKGFDIVDHLVRKGMDYQTLEISGIRKSYHNRS